MFIWFKIFLFSDREACAIPDTENEEVIITGGMDNRNRVLNSLRTIVISNTLMFHYYITSLLTIVRSVLKTSNLVSLISLANLFYITYLFIL